MSSNNRADSRSIELPTGVSLRSGVRSGLFFAAAISAVAVGRIALALAVVAISGHFQAARDLPSITRLLEFVIPAYFVGFSIAGALYAGASHLTSRMLRYPVAGVLCGSAIYGAVGVSVDVMDGKGLDWKDIGTFVGVIACFFAVLGFLMGALDEWRERRGAARPAS
jgi:hypothetical protein